MTITCNIRTKSEFKKIALSFPEATPIQQHGLDGSTVDTHVAALPDDVHIVEGGGIPARWYANVTVRDGLVVSVH